MRGLVGERLANNLPICFYRIATHLKQTGRARTGRARERCSRERAHKVGYTGRTTYQYISTTWTTPQPSARPDASSAWAWVHRLDDSGDEGSSLWARLAHGRKNFAKSGRKELGDTSSALQRARNRELHCMIWNRFCPWFGSIGAVSRGHHTGQRVQRFSRRRRSAIAS